MNTIVVHPTDSHADASSLTRALSMAQTGDVILLSPGTYSPLQTGEVLPLKIPAGVALEGGGWAVCFIDSDGQFEQSFNPIQTDMSVIMLDDSASVSGITVTNGGGHVIGASL